MVGAGAGDGVRQNPTILEINTWTWLNGLAARLGYPVTLSTVPADVWDELGARGFDAVWLMGVWQRSPAGVAIGLDEETLVDSFRDALDDFTVDDVVGSPYCVEYYMVDKHLGGPAALEVARAELAARGMKLILDWVPNHVATDHQWARTDPERFILGTGEDIEAAPYDFVDVDGRIIANGRDPFFPPWRDVLQLNAFNESLREAAVATLRTVAEQCDGVRCDMAMLMLNHVFARTWGDRAGEVPDDEYWSVVISEVRARYPEFVFIAEAYWDTENELRALGFDYCYDKALYDTVEHHPVGVGKILDEDPVAQQHSVRFIENHDEPRAQQVFGDRHRCVAITVLTQPGARLIHDGQSAGRRIRTPVQLARDPFEPVDAELEDFYARLLTVLSRDVFHQGRWRRCDVHGWPDCPSSPGLFVWEWTLDDERVLIAVNLADDEGRGLVGTGWADLESSTIALDDPITGDHHLRDGSDIASELFVKLPAWGFHVFDVHPGS